MSSEVEEILDLFISKESRFESLKSYLFASRGETWSFGVFAAGFVLGSVTWFINQKYSLIGFGVSLTALLIFIIVGAFSSLAFIANPRRDVLLAIKTANLESAHLINELSQFKVASLRSVRDLFDRRIHVLIGRVGFLVGALDKLGLFPALFMLYYTYTKLPNAEELSNIHLWLLSFTCGLYIGVILIKSVVDSLQSSIVLIDSAIEQASEYKLP
ncbi:hypothetical protein J0674_23830 [Vibrio parahaemolyticus]|uniref:hypothetical protein n=1 Tax=Vibrio parahaemolyticus TaxID=670 RepID=UPI001A8F3D14|nr:hypothetical protein [Vibrio parahaemolyticus]MBO0160038.1 hypothetical protein [Vibrio parahaemolyticus]MBO0175233.1 hypothetical protein [Vibrio parahaemolyticus]MEA5286007.1 hypothetical protein [Vibrio parahaemolyticus]HCE1578224.1 hypothetical protein [Vibrio parahaemolyticus]HCG5291709.1 hypothetical protein [Vibrio parahaemolyticus]